MPGRIRVKPLDWAPYIEPVDVAQADQKQREAMQVTPSSIGVSPYVRTLAHDPESYLARTILFNAIMYAPGGLPRADRELGALGASVVNGCPYCAMVHARRLTDLTGSDDAVTALWRDRPDLLSQRGQAIWSFARALSTTPSSATPAHIRALRDAGLSETDIIDLIHAVAIFGWANRLMHPLGHVIPAADKR
ncbi:peroxidase-related enzyme [Gluconacetobacter sp. Hr-1-5]|uniref:peroxidase-related enzyme n=1 Tax=Gluconacetobacter sp. Hr-1-5 TaxID=3395370 RepID=UPI003B528526